MTTPDFIRDVAVESGIRMTDVRAVTVAIESVIRKYLSNGEKFKLSDVIFDVKDVAERTARNPSTGEKVTVPAHKKISIKAASNLIRDIQ